MAKAEGVRPQCGQPKIFVIHVFGNLRKQQIEIFKNSKVFIMFAFAVSTRLYRIALAFAPLEDSIITKFFRPMVKGRIACSA